MVAALAPFGLIVAFRFRNECICGSNLSPHFSPRATIVQTQRAQSCIEALAAESNADKTALPRPVTAWSIFFDYIRKRALGYGVAVALIVDDHYMIANNGRAVNSIVTNHVHPALPLPSVKGYGAR